MVVLERFGVVVIRGLGIVDTGSIRSRVIFRCLTDVVLGSLGVVLWLSGDVAQGRVILLGGGVVARGSVGCSVALQLFGVIVVNRGIGVVGRGIISCGLILWSLGGVVLGGLGVVNGRCVCCCVVRRRRCGLVSAIPRGHRHTRRRPSHQRYNTQQQHDAIVTRQLINLNNDIQSNWHINKY